MPTVMSFDDPRLLLTLASQAGQYAHDRDSQSQAMALQKMAIDAVNNAPNYGMHGGGGAIQLAPAPGPWEEKTAEGQTIYHPGGWQDAPGPGAVNAAGQSLYGAPGGGREGVNANGALITATQKANEQLITQMEQSGALTKEEAFRYRGVNQNGGNPFGAPTESERLRQYQTERQGSQDQQVNEQIDRQAKFDYERDRQRINDLIASKEKILAQTAQTAERSKIAQDIQGLQQELQQTATKDYYTPARDRLTKTRPTTSMGQLNQLLNGSTGPAPQPGAQIFSPASPAPGTSGLLQGAAPGGGATQAAQPNAPLTQADVQYLVAAYGGDAQAARAAAARGERAPR